MIDTDIERLLYHMPVVAERASNAWTKKFATDMAKRARFRNWKPRVRTRSCLKART